MQLLSLLYIGILKPESLITEPVIQDINFAQIRARSGSQQTAFQELIALLARDDKSADQRFWVKGAGADGGLECYLINPDKTERGWQAKYVSNWEEAAGQLTKSFDRALSAHPNMDVFVACVPFDLSDGRQKSKKSGRPSKSAKAKYDDWKATRISEAKKQGRDVEIEFWGASEIRDRLLKGNAAQARIRYWFDRDLLTDDVMQRLFRRAASALGPRYVAEHHVELPIKSRIDAICRNPQWRDGIEKALIALRKSVDKIQLMSKNPSLSAVSPLARLTEAGAQIAQTCQAWEMWNADRKSVFPAEEISGALLTLKRYCRPEPAIGEANEMHPSIGDELENIALRADGLGRYFAGYKDNISNNRCLLVSGEGGIGKSHLLASAVQAQLNSGLPAILVLAGGFSAHKPIWSSVSEALEESSLRDPTVLLESLDAAGSALGEKALICIDAINEGAAYERWAREVSAFIQRASEHENIVVVLSCRTPALPVVLPSRPIKELAEITHPGFGGTGGRAADAYLKSRGVSRSPLSRPTDEFDNPLLLKLICDAVKADGLNQIPEHLNHLSEFFNYALSSVSTEINTALGLDPFLDYPKKALRAFARKALEEYGLVDYETAHLVCSQIHATPNSQRSLLRALIGSGVLTQTVRPQSGTTQNVVRFTFERLGDFITASDLLDEGLQNNVLQPGSRLAKIVRGEAALSSTVLPSIALVLADQHGLELVEFNADILADGGWLHAFKESVARRRPDALSARAMDLAKTHLKDEELFAIAISRIGQNGSRLTPDWLDDELRARDMIERDLTWSNYLLQDHGRLHRSAIALIEWAETANLSGVEKGVIRNLYRLFGWLLTASHREIRDRATKCLVRTITVDLKIGVKLIEWVQDVDDIYVTERVYAAIYGAALQSPNDPSLTELAHAVYDFVFKDNTPPANLLLRDHAVAFLQLAESKSAIEPQKLPFPVTGPYADPGPLEYVPKDWKPQGYDSEESWSDQVESSLGEMGDFGNKIVNHFVAKWSPAELGVASLPTERELFEDWYNEAVMKNSHIAAAWQEFDAIVLKWNADGRPDPYQMSDDWLQALDKFKDSIGEISYREFERRALSYVRRWLHSSDTHSQPAIFDQAWARRWLWKRVRELGWNPTQFAEIDRPIGGGRHDHRRERLGKKYQWIALYELGARLQDHYAFRADGWTEDRSKPVPYTYGDDVQGLRNIDPSLLRRETHYDGWTQWPSTWWSPRVPTLDAMAPREQLDWLHSPQDYIRGEELIAVRDPRDGSEWLTLSGFVRASKSLDDKSLGSETWCRTQCFVVPSDQAEATLAELGQHILTSPSDPVRAEIPYWMYLGEVGIKQSIANAGQERAPFRYEGVGDIWATTVSYLRESTTYDHSIASNIGAEVPLPWLSRLCGASFSDGIRMSYVDGNGRTVFFDPSVDFEGPSTCLVRRDVFLKAMAEAELTPIWVEAGEKGIFGNDSYGGRVTFTRLYTLEDAQWAVREKTEKEYPSETQLRKFLSDEENPSDAEVKRWSRKRPIEPSNKDMEGGLSAETVKRIREDLLGLKSKK